MNKRRAIKKEVKKADRNDWLWAEMPQIPGEHLLLRTAWAETCMCAQLLCAHMYICVYTCTHVCACTNYTPTWTLKETQYKYVRDLPNCLVQTSYQQYMMGMECTSGFCLKASQCFKQSETQTFLCPGKRTPIGMGSWCCCSISNMAFAWGNVEHGG